MNQENMRAVLRRFNAKTTGITNAAMYRNFNFPIEECNEIIKYLIAQDIIEATTFSRGEGLNPLYGWKLKISADEQEKLLLL